MYKGHPWEGERFGAVEYEWYLARGYELCMIFEVDMGPFIRFCKEEGHRSNSLTMKIATRLSAEHLPQYMIALNGRPRPTRYAAGYVRPITPKRDMLEHVAIREKDNAFAERAIRDSWKSIPTWLAEHAPRLSAKLATWFPGEETNNNYALMVTRNMFRNLNTRVIFTASHFRTMILGIPFGEKVFCTFTAPHAFGNINLHEPFMARFKEYMEQPETIPGDILEKPYKAVVSKDQQREMEKEGRQPPG